MLVEQILMELSVLNFNLVLGPVEGVAELIHPVGDERAACYFATDQLANELKIVSKSKTNRILPISTSLMLHLDSHSGALFLDRRIRQADGCGFIAGCLNRFRSVKLIPNLRSLKRLLLLRVVGTICTHSNAGSSSRSLSFDRR